MEKLEVGQKWINSSGNIYRIEMFTNTEGTDPLKKEKFPPTVVYSCTESGTFWSCSIEQWRNSSKQKIK